MGMRQGEFVQVVHVGDAKVQRGCEDQSQRRRGRRGVRVQREDDGAEQDLLHQGAGDVRPPSDPTTQGLVQPAPLDPAAPSAGDDGFFEERPGKEEGG